MYWRMLAINPSVAGEIVLAEKPAITTDSDRMDRGALDQLLLHTGTLGSIYHKNPEASITHRANTRMIGSLNLFFVGQTFIRNAAGKALTDSPALNAASRQVLVPLSRPVVPSAVRVAGPGPSEPPREDKPVPPAPTGGSDSGLVDASADGHYADGDGDAGDGGDADGTEEYGAGPGAARPAAPLAASVGDPYANLDSAFGGYSLDEPKPHTNNLLF